MMKLELLNVNRELCAKCGICAEVCPNGIIGMAADGPKLLVAEGCINCGHCVAVCPNAALDYTAASLTGQTPLPEFPVLDAATARNFLRSRRSIRNYRKEKVSRETILELLDIARFAPTGCNSQGLSYLAIDNPSILSQVTVLTVEWMEEQIKSGAPWASDFFTGLVEIYHNTGKDLVLREAPCLILATAPQSFPMGHDNARHCLEYIDLFATSLGLGTCWAGFVEMAANYQPLLKTLHVPDDTAIVGAMMAGYPKFAYRRLVNRNPLQVKWL
jgi:nitroreductase/NAD-dependent dihydropyrimidine dehydrogenase PreA subunit